MSLTVFCFCRLPFLQPALLYVCDGGVRYVILNAVHHTVSERAADTVFLPERMQRLLLVIWRRLQHSIFRPSVGQSTTSTPLPLGGGAHAYSDGGSNSVSSTNS